MTGKTEAPILHENEDYGLITVAEKTYSRS
jgi:hypothetical protein